MAGSPEVLRAQADALRQEATALEAQAEALRRRADVLEASGPGQAGPPVADLTVEDLAEAYDKAPSTIRQWLQGVPGLYRIGQELRISRKDWRRYLDSLPDKPPSGDPERESPSGRRLSDWREELDRTREAS